MLAPDLIRGTQTPRIRVAPPYSTSAAQECVEFVRDIGLRLDPWQELALRDGLGERADGRWAAFEVGLIVSRQNGKGGVLEARQLGGLFLFGERLQIHTAHQFRTTQEHFRRVRDLIDGSDDLRRKVDRIRTADGEEAVELKNRQRLRFVARSGASGRGFSGDVTYLDEAMILDEDAIGALLPTMSARPNPQLWYTASAGNRRSAVLGRLRRRGLAKLADPTRDPRLAFSEYSLDEALVEAAREADGREPHGQRLQQLISDPRTWAGTNPALNVGRHDGSGITEEFIASELAAMGLAEFMRERLGVGDYPSDEANRWLVIPRDQWEPLADEGSEVIRRPGETAFAVEMSWDRTAAAIGVCGRRGDGLFHVEIPVDADGRSDYRAGPPHWLPPRLKQLVDQWRPARVVINGKGPAGTLVPDIEALGVEVYQPTHVELGQAFGRFSDTVEAGGLRHLNEAALSTALAGAASRKVGDAVAWDMKEASTDSAPLIVATNALWGLATAPAPARFFASYR